VLHTLVFPKPAASGAEMDHSMNRRVDRPVTLAARLLFALAVLACASAVFVTRASGQDEFDQCKLHLDGYWFYSTPTGTVQGHADSGYGSFVSTAGDIGVKLSKHSSMNAGYSLASHLTVYGAQDRLSLQLSQKGPSVGMEF